MYDVSKALARARDGRGIPQAIGLAFGECDLPDCDAVHIALFRHDGKPLARMAMSVEQIEALAQRAGFKLIREAN